MSRKFIKLKSPSVVLNAPNITNKWRMTYSYTVPWSMSAHEMIKQHVHSTARHLVFNCHGFAWRPNFQAPHLSIGTVVHAGNVSAFDPLGSYPQLRVIWISACTLASSQEGQQFCVEMARHARAYVVASIVGTPDVASPAGSILDPVDSMPYIVDPKGNPTGQQTFRALGPSLGFA